MVFLVPGIINKSGFPKSSFVVIYLIETSSSIFNASKSVKLDMRGSFITAISIGALIFLLNSTAPSSSSNWSFKYGTTPTVGVFFYNILQHL